MIDYLIKMAIGGGLAGVLLLIFCLIKKYRARKLIYIVVFALYIGALLTFTLWRTPTPGLTGKLNLVPFADLIRNLQRDNYYHVLQMLVNLGMFVPLGILLRTGKVRLRWSVLIALGASLIIEIVQVILIVGYFDTDDVILNVIGAFAGYLFTALLLKLRRKTVGH